MESSHPLSKPRPAGAAHGRPVQLGLLGIIALALGGVVVAAVEGRPGWVYGGVAIFMVAGVALALHTALVASRPRVIMRTAGFAPTRESGIWRAIVDGVPIEARIAAEALCFRAEGIPDGLGIEAGPCAQPTGAPAFDAWVRCTGRRAWIAAIGPGLRGALTPLLRADARVERGALWAPPGGVELVGAAATTCARLAHTYGDLRAALVARAREDGPAEGGLTAIAALAAGWPDDPATIALTDALLVDPDPAIRLTVAEAIAARALEELARLAADPRLEPALRVRALVAQVGASGGAARRRVLVAAAAEPCFAAEARRLATTFGVSLVEEDDP